MVNYYSQESDKRIQKLVEENLDLVKKIAQDIRRGATIYIEQ